MLPLNREATATSVNLLYWLGNLDLQNANCLSEEVRATYSFGQLPFLCHHVFPFPHTHAHTVQCKINVIIFATGEEIPCAHFYSTSHYYKVTWDTASLRTVFWNCVGDQHRISWLHNRDFFWFRSESYLVHLVLGSPKASVSVCLALPQGQHIGFKVWAFFRARKRLMLKSVSSICIWVSATERSTDVYLLLIWMLKWVKKRETREIRLLDYTLYHYPTT